MPGLAAAAIAVSDMGGRLITDEGADALKIGCIDREVGNGFMLTEDDIALSSAALAVAAAAITDEGVCGTDEMLVDRGSCMELDTESGSALAPLEKVLPSALSGDCLEPVRAAPSRAEPAIDATCFVAGGS